MFDVTRTTNTHDNRRNALPNTTGTRLYRIITISALCLTVQHLFQLADLRHSLRDSEIKCCVVASCVRVVATQWGATTRIAHAVEGCPTGDRRFLNIGLPPFVSATAMSPSQHSRKKPECSQSRQRQTRKLKIAYFSPRCRFTSFATCLPMSACAVVK